MLLCRDSELTSLDECEALYITVCLFLFQIYNVRTPPPSPPTKKIDLVISLKPEANVPRY